MKLLKDYARDKWLEAADVCDYCGARYEVKVTSVDDDGFFGEVAYRVSHTKDCTRRYDVETGVDLNAEVLHDVAGWTFKEKTVAIRDRELLPIASRANIGPCLWCDRLVVQGPVILFIDDGRGGELDFCFGCVKALKLLP